MSVVESYAMLAHQSFFFSFWSKGWPTYAVNEVTRQQTVACFVGFGRLQKQVRKIPALSIHNANEMGTGIDVLTALKMVLT